MCVCVFFLLLPCFLIPGEVFIKVKKNYRLQRYFVEGELKNRSGVKEEGFKGKHEVTAGLLKLNLN